MKETNKAKIINVNNEINTTFNRLKELQVLIKTELGLKELCV